MFIVKYLKSLLYILVGLLISGLIITIFNYFNILPNALKYFKLILIVLSFDPDAIRFVSFSNAKQFTVELCPFKFLSTVSSVFHILIVLSPPPEANQLLGNPTRAKIPNVCSLRISFVL